MVRDGHPLLHALGHCPLGRDSRKHSALKIIYFNNPRRLAGEVEAATIVAYNSALVLDSRSNRTLSSTHEVGILKQVPELTGWGLSDLHDVQLVPDSTRTSQVCSSMRRRWMYLTCVPLSRDAGILTCGNMRTFQIFMAGLTRDGRSSRQWVMVITVVGVPHFSVLWGRKARDRSIFNKQLDFACTAGAC